MRSPVDVTRASSVTRSSRCSSIPGMAGCSGIPATIHVCSTPPRPSPYSLYRRITPLFIRPELSVASQLDAFGLSPADIRLIFVSHFHADHVAGLRDFPNATYVTLRAAYQHVAPLSGFSALRRGFLPMLLPPDFERRASFPDTFDGPLLPGLGPTCDYFGDGSLLLVLLPGHARGQIGMLAQTESGSRPLRRRLLLVEPLDPRGPATGAHRQFHRR